MKNYFLVNLYNGESIYIGYTSNNIFNIVNVSAESSPDGIAIDSVERLLKILRLPFMLVCDEDGNNYTYNMFRNVLKLGL